MFISSFSLLLWGFKIIQYDIYTPLEVSRSKRFFDANESKDGQRSFSTQEKNVYVEHVVKNKWEPKI